MNMNRRVVVSVLLALFVLAGLSSPVVSQAPTDAVLVLHFDEGSGTIAKDESGHGNDGTIHGATWTTGVSGKALQFDGVDDYVDCGDPADGSLDFGTGDFTAEAWIKTSTNKLMGVVIKMNNCVEGMGWVFIAYTTPDVRFFIDDGIASPGPISTQNYNDGAWHHIVGVREGNTARLYYDGSEVKTEDISGIGSVSNSQPLLIGGEYSPGARGRDQHFNGVIDEVAIYNRALSPEEIKAHYLAKRAGGSTKDSTPDLIDSVSTRIDALKRSNIDTSLIEQSLTNAQDAYDSGNHDEAFELAQNAQKMADDAYDAQQHIESAESEIDDAKSIGADVKDAENKLKEAKEALNKGNYEYAHDWAADASDLAKHASIGSVQIKDLKALATRYDQRTVAISGTIRDIETVYGEGYTFALDDGSGMISVVYQGSLGDIKDGDKVTASGIFEASTGTVVADNVQKSGVGGGGVPGFEVIFAIAGLLAVAYVLRRRK